MFPDYLIIGAGAVGLATALELNLRGARVTLLERGRSGGESTWAGGGILSPLLPWQYGDAVNALAEYSRRLFPEWCARLEDQAGQAAEYRNSGMLVLPPFDRPAATNWCRRHDWRCEVRPGADFLETARPDEALWLPDVAQVRNPRLGQVMRGAAVAAGIRIVEAAEVLAMQPEGRTIRRVSTTQGEFSAAGIIVCAGAWSGVLPGMETLGSRVFPVRGQMLLFKLSPGILRNIVLRDGAYLIPRQDGHILAGSTLEWTGFDKSTTQAARQNLLAFASGILPALNEQSLVMQWSGLRPGSPGNLPLIAALPDYDNLFVNSGHFRYGVTMAPGSALLLADLIEGRQPAIDASPYQFREGGYPGNNDKAGFPSSRE